jgi:hypothetical protein
MFSKPIDGPFDCDHGEDGVKYLQWSEFGKMELVRDSYLRSYHPFIVDAKHLDEFYSNPASYKQSGPSKCKEGGCSDANCAASRHIECPS